MDTREKFSKVKPKHFWQFSKLSISLYQKNFPFFAPCLHLQGNVMLRPLVSVLKLDLVYGHLFLYWKCKVLAQCIISQYFWDIQAFSFYYSWTFWQAKSLSRNELICPGRIQNSGNLFYPSCPSFSKILRWDDLLNYFFSFLLLFHY